MTSRYRCDALTMQLSYEATDGEKPLMLRRREHKKEIKKERSQKRGEETGERKGGKPVIFANFSHALHFRVSFPPLSLSLEQAT